MSDSALNILRKMIATPSVSKNEEAVAALLIDELKALGLPAAMNEKNIVCRIEKGNGPTLMLNSHIDTVPAASGYTRDPHDAEVKDDRVWGLGSNDAGGAVVSMIAAAAELNKRDDWQGTLLLALTVEEEISGQSGLEYLLTQIEMPDAAIVGEPTALEICVAQKGLVVMDCTNVGQTCHAANAYRVEHKNAILEATKDIPKVYEIEFADPDPFLGPTTLNVTVVHGGTVHNSIPDKCTWKIDARVNPAQSLDDVVDAVKDKVSADVSPRSLRLQPFHTAQEEPIVQAALKARPQAKAFGSDTMSDATFLRSIPVIKVGPGVTEMSHKPDEYLDLHWIDEGIAFYRDTAISYFKSAVSKP